MSKTLLLADDSVTIQKVVGISFASEDVVLIAVDNGDDAIARAREEHPDAILADVVMPGKNGYEVCEAIKADPSTSHIPVLLLTGTFEAFDAERAGRVGAAGHIAKPFESQALVEVVTNLFAAPPPVAKSAEERTLESPVAVAQPAAPAAAAHEQSAEAFDFFDDDLEPADVVGEAESLETDDSLDSADSAFDFGDEDLAAGSVVGPTEEIPIAIQSAPEAELEAIEVDQVDTDDDSLDAHLDDDLSVDAQFEIDTDFGRPQPATSELDAAIAFGDAPDADDASLLDTANDSIDGPFDFAFESTPDDELDPLSISSSELTPVDADDLAQEATLFAEGGEGRSDYDVSSSDLGPVVAGSETTVLLETESDSGPELVLESEPMVELPSDELHADDLHTDDLHADNLHADNLRADKSIEFNDASSAPTDSDGGAEALAATDPVAWSSGDTAPDVDESALEPAFESAPEEPAVHALEEAEVSIAAQAHAVPEPLAASSSASALDAPSDSPTPSPRAASMAPPVATPVTPSQAPADTASRAESVLERIEPQLRVEIHDTLEKIAWESFGDLTDAIVRQSVEKVEQIAWEVVPQLIETLVREEIRKMKGEPPSDE